MAVPKRLICTDLDRTLIPNGAQPESPQARARFRDWVSQPNIALAYVTGRHKELVEAAIATYDLPVPNVVIADVGATLYEIHAGKWHLNEAWRSHISQDWQGKTAQELQPDLADLPALTLQEPEKQNLYKLSYYFTLECDIQELIQAVSSRLAKNSTVATLISSIDEANAIGLLDILPAKANKLLAIEFWMSHQGYALANTLFAGDSGNDLSVLVSSIPSVLVANAHPDVKQEALERVNSLGNSDRLYIAKGDVWGMNGNYSAGILEGAAHYFPEVGEWLSQHS